LKSDALGVDDISLKMLCMTLPYSLTSVTNLVNMSINTWIFPYTWKTAVVRPVHKKPNAMTLSDLRPISILPCLSKILEKVISSQLTDYLEKHNILPEYQSGFRRSRGTATALLDVTDNIL
ncbi:hypothetical protein F3G48_33095, partial [Pseudomonas aeruginosa]